MSKHRFAAVLDDLGTVYEKDVSPALKRLYWEDLGHLPIETIEAAASAHRRDPDRGRFFPKPADLLAKVPGHAPMTADEAWGLCLTSFDESDTAIMNEAIDAGRAAALPVWDQGDKIGARMAFRSAYDRAVSMTPRITWRLSLGWDREKQEQAAEKALKAGWLTHDAVMDYLPAPEPAGAAAVVAGLLSGKVVPIRGDDTETRARLAALKSAINPVSAQGELVAEERERFEKRKRKEIARLEDFARKRM